MEAAPPLSTEKIITLTHLFFVSSSIGSESWSTWNCLQNCLKSGCRSSFSDSEAIEISFLKRCVSMVIQRLARSSEPWTVDTLRGDNYFVFISSLSLSLSLSVCLSLSLSLSLCLSLSASFFLSLSHSLSILLSLFLSLSLSFSLSLPLAVHYHFHARVRSCVPS